MRWQTSARAGPAARARPSQRKRAGRDQKPFRLRKSLLPGPPRELENQGVESPQQKEGLAMQIHSPSPQQSVSELDRLGDEIAELSAHLDAAAARLLELIRAFDARGGWNTGFRSCAAGGAGSGRGPGTRPGRACPRDAASLGRGHGPR